MTTDVVTVFTALKIPPSEVLIIPHTGPGATTKTSLILVQINPTAPPSEPTLTQTNIPKKAIAVETTFVSTTNPYTAMPTVQVITPLRRHPGVHSSSILTSPFRLLFTAYGFAITFPTRVVGDQPRNNLRDSMTLMMAQPEKLPTRLFFTSLPLLLPPLVLLHLEFLVYIAKRPRSPPPSPSIVRLFIFATLGGGF